MRIKLEKCLGAQKSVKYFNLLTRYLSLKLHKSEFDKLCIRLIGRENIHLHNELIRAVLKNATVAKTPPAKQVKHDTRLNFKDPNESNDGLHERKFKDRSSPLEFEVISEQDAKNRVSCRRISITAPFGVSIHSNRTRKVLENDSGSGQFLSRNSLENRLRQKLKMKGLDISVDCVRLLNNGLDSYLKRVIKPSLELASSRVIHEPRKRFTASLLDFQMATMTNPEMLGEDWSIHLEKICSSGFDNNADSRRRDCCPLKHKLRLLYGSLPGLWIKKRFHLVDHIKNSLA
ncbi:hypothetical protein QVD17_06511 [Tagetes erecta]|uniref:Uncharacterized protein n=1 Tax=Tagetes erecta TaxID=13708 RepID=A0AAD8LLU8_TARER|nr:hypothetical protein QVD17_06511 [Tagetes erecta]